VKRIYPEPDRVFFTLSSGSTGMNPRSGYYYVSRTHANFDAVSALLDLAATNRWKVQVRTRPDLDSNGYAEVVYVVVDF